MAAPTKSFTIIPDASIDPDSPLTTTLMTQLRDNDQNVAAQIVGEPLATTIGNAQAPHTHDGTDSSLIEAGNLVFLEQHETTANETSFTFSTGIDGDTDETYMLFWRVIASANATLRIDPNNTGNDIIISTLIANTLTGTGVAVIFTKRTVQTIGMRVQTISISGREDGILEDVVVDSVAGTAIGGNITSFEINGTIGSGIGKGSTFALYRLKQS